MSVLSRLSTLRERNLLKAVERKRTRDERELAEKAHEDAVRATMPPPPTEGVAETVERLWALVMKTSTDAEGRIIVNLRMANGSGIFFCPPELHGDPWWTAVCEWERARHATRSITTADASVVRMIDVEYTDSVRDLLNKGFDDADAKLRWFGADHVRITVKL